MARSGDGDRIASLGKYGGTTKPTFAADLSELSATIGDLLWGSVSTASLLPSDDDNVAGRICYVEDEDELYRHDGTSWLRVWSDGSPYAVAAGSGSNDAGSFGDVTFPTGRFTVSPVVTGVPDGNYPYVFLTSNVTTTGFKGGLFDSSGNAQASQWKWVAVQMTATSADG